MSYKLGLINMIPSAYIRSISVRENGEFLVSVVSSERIIAFCPEEEAVLVRKTVLNKLIAASLMLPKGFKLKVLYGYRSIGIQAKFWEETCAKIKERNPNLTTKEIENEARFFSAMPNGNGPHQTGGAVDVLIVDAEGQALNFGTEYRGYNKVVPMHSKFITFEQEQSRKMLRNVMRSAGFVYYPGEWWHYSFGDQTWATYTGNKYALYDFI